MLVNTVTNLWFIQNAGNFFLLAEDLLVSQGGPCSIELFILHYFI